MLKRCLSSAIALAFLATVGFSQQKPEDHEPEINGLRIGMSAGEVLEVMQRVGDSDKEEKGELIIYWKLENEDVLQVHFWNNVVSHLGIKYHTSRPAIELGLVTQVDQRSSLDSRDLNARFDYKQTETRDKSRLVWSRQVSTDLGYDPEIQFLSGARQQFGEQRAQFVEFKYVSLPKNERKKFEKAVKQAAQ